MLNHEWQYDTVLLNPLQWLSMSRRIKAKLYKHLQDCYSKRTTTLTSPGYLLEKQNCRTQFPSVNQKRHFHKSPSWRAYTRFFWKCWPTGPWRTCPPTLLGSPTSFCSPTPPQCLVSSPFMKHTRNPSRELFSGTDVLPAGTSPDLLPHLLQFFPQNEAF